MNSKFTLSVVRNIIQIKYTKNIFRQMKLKKKMLHSTFEIGADNNAFKM